jgi:hypothetical protein
VYRKTYKAGICFYANYKAVIDLLFRKFFGNQQGYQLYKKFTLFERQCALEALKKCSKNLEDKAISDIHAEVIKLADEVIIEKAAKLKSLSKDDYIKEEQSSSSKCTIL